MSPFPEFESLRTWPKAARVERLIQLLEALEAESGAEAVKRAIGYVAGFGSNWVWLIDKVAKSESCHERVREACADYVEQASSVRFEVGDRTGLNRTQIDQLLASLEVSRRKVPNLSLHFHFSRRQVYPYGLCAIAAWATQNARKIEFFYETERTQEFLHAAGVIDALRDPEGDPVRFDRKNLIGFTRIQSGVVFPTDEHAGRLVGLFRQNLPGLSASSAKSLGIAFAELIENVVKHAGIQSDAWLFANYHPKPGIMHMAICDRGRGIRQSFLESDSDAVRQIGEHPVDWISKCTDPLVTSKTTGHAGYGLYVVRELCRRNTGSLLLLGGRPSYKIEFREQAGGGLREEESVLQVAQPWNGTFLGLNLKLDQPLPLGEIYASLPPPRGYAAEDTDIDLFTP